MKTFLLAFITILSSTVTPTMAIEINPSPELIDRAIKDGEDARDINGIESVANVFGKRDHICGGYGFLQTKLWSIRETSKENAKKMRPINMRDVEQSLLSKTMVVTYSFCSVATKPLDHHMVFKQRDKVIQPIEVHVVRPSYLSFLRYPTFSHTVQATFRYDSFDPMAETTVIVIPSFEEKREYKLDLAEFR